MNTNSIKDCPFCGAEADLEVEAAGTPAKRYVACVSCPDCYSIMKTESGPTEQGAAMKAIREWNTRAQ